MLPENINEIVDKAKKETQDLSLSLNISKLEPNEEFKYDINLYPLKKEEFNICCLLLDKDKKEVYFCPSIINLKVNWIINYLIY